MIRVFAPDGIPEVTPGMPLAPVIVAAVAADPAGPLRDHDIVVVTSKVVSKSEGRGVPAADRAAAIEAQTAATVARRGDTAIVRTPTGLTTAAAGVDASNVAPRQVLLLPADPDASAARLRAELQQATGCRLGVVVSDTAGRPWRMGQTDHAIGAAGIAVLVSYVGQADSSGQPLQVTAVAVADELAAAADLAKGKLAGRPVAVVRGLLGVVDTASSPTAQATDLIRPRSEDLFAYGRREAVLAAVLDALDQADRYEDLVALEADALVAAVAADQPAAEADLIARVLRSAAQPLPDLISGLQEHRRGSPA